MIESGSRVRVSMRAARRFSESPSPLALLLALFAVLALGPVLPADSAAEQREADARQKLYVRRALNDDAGLKGYAAELWVDVRGTVAVLGGQVPSAMLKQRALFLAGQVKGIAEVRGDSLLVVACEGVSDLPSPFPEGTTPPGTLAGNRHDGHATEAPRKADAPEAEPAARPLYEAVTLLPPRPLPAADDLATAAEALRQKDERFRRLKVEVRQKTVYVRGFVTRWADVNEFTQAVRRLPGVAGVMMDDVQVDPTGSRG
jgi:osmotically-inducible protein OsmY